MTRRWQRKPEKPAPLFDPPRGGMAATSIAAARSMQSHAPRIIDRVFSFIASRGDRGATNEECSQELNILLQSVTPSTNSLWRRGRIRNSGRERLTSSGRGAIVWITVGQGGHS